MPALAAFPFLFGAAPAQAAAPLLRPSAAARYLPPRGFARGAIREAHRRRLAPILDSHGFSPEFSQRILEAALERAPTAPFETALADGLACVLRFEPMHPRPQRPLILLRLAPTPLAPLVGWMAERAARLGAPGCVIAVGDAGEDQALADSAKKAGAFFMTARDLAAAGEALGGRSKGGCVWVAPPPLGARPGADADAIRKFAEARGLEAVGVAGGEMGPGLAGAPALARAGARRLIVCVSEGDSLGGPLSATAGGFALAGFGDPASAESCENASALALARRMLSGRV